MKASFYNAADVAVPIALFRVTEPPDSNLLVHVAHVEALPREDEMVSVAGAMWWVQKVIHLVGPGDDYEARVWLRPVVWREAP